LPRWIAQIPLDRVQTAGEIANVVVFLASAEASAMTGQAINVTGGMVTE
jgi:sorbitol-6-phosphate 2-dehydrogenase